MFYHLLDQESTTSYFRRLVTCIITVNYKANCICSKYLKMLKTLKNTASKQNWSIKKQSKNEHNVPVPPTNDK